MAESLNPTLTSRLTRGLRPHWTRTVLARRITAGVLVLLAGVAALRPDTGGDGTEVVVAAHDLNAGTPLSLDDVRLETRSASTVPDGSQTDIAAVAAATLAGPARRGEVLTDVRLLGPRLAESAIGHPNARLVAVHLADPGLIDLVRPGDVVDILAGSDNAAPTQDGTPRVVAANAVVVVVSAKQQAQPDSRVVLVALPAAAANAAAGAALSQAVTLTLH